MTIEMENAQIREDIELSNANPDATIEMTVEWGTRIGGSGVEAPIETISQNGVQLPISDKNVNIDAYTKSQIDDNYNIKNFAVKINPKFDTIYKLSTQDNAPLLLSRSTIETINGKRFFNIDIVWQNFFPGTSPFQGFEQNEILFLFPRFAGTNYSDYSNLITTQARYSKQEFYELIQYYTVGWINRCDTVNISTGTAVAMPCQITQLGEVINNTNGFFKSTTSTLNRNYHITGIYEIAEDWTLQEYEDYVFQIS